MRLIVEHQNGSRDDLEVGHVIVTNDPRGLSVEHATRRDLDGGKLDAYVTWDLFREATVEDRDPVAIVGAVMDFVNHLLNSPWQKWQEYGLFVGMHEYYIQEWRSRIRDGSWWGRLDSANRRILVEEAIKRHDILRQERADYRSEHGHG